jgi:hypothetical protein
MVRYHGLKKFPKGHCFIMICRSASAWFAMAVNRFHGYHGLKNSAEVAIIVLLSWQNLAMVSKVVKHRWKNCC